VLKEKSLLNRILILSVTLLFCFNSATYGLDRDVYNLAPPSNALSPQEAPTDEAASFRQTVREDMVMTTVSTAIAEYFLGDVPQEEGSTLKDQLFRYLQKLDSIENWSWTLWNSLHITVDNVGISNDIVHIPFKRRDDREGWVYIAEASRIEELKEADPAWEKLDEKYAILIKRNDISDSFEEEKDLKAEEALETNPIIQDLIKSERLVEIYFDAETDTLKANRVEWVEAYSPLLTLPADYRGEEIDIYQLFSKSERKELEEWIKTHKIRGAPIKFRIALGSPLLGWKDEIEHANIAHAGCRDKVIYIGGLLLKHILKKENRNLRDEILDNDEFRHLRRLSHGSRDAWEARCKLVINEIKTSELESFSRGMLVNSEDNVYSLRDHIRDRLDDPSRLLDMFSMINDIAMSQPLYPVERLYPIKKAVALLKKEEQDRLVNIFISGESQEEGYRLQVVIDDILLMLEDAKMVKTRLKDWIKVNAPELKGRSLWQISPEIWHEAGGLARVMQYHGAGIIDLITNEGGASHVKLRHVEPHYQYRIDPDGKPHPLDYRNRYQLTHPIKGELEEVDRFTVTMMVLDETKPVIEGDINSFMDAMVEKEVEVVVSRGVNDLGIEVFLIRDLQEDGRSYYTHSLYNYRPNFASKEIDRADGRKRPSWEEFSVFYSKAALEFVRRFENKEKKGKEKRKEEWKAPLLHTNDSQAALISVYSKILLENQKAKKEKNPAYQIDPVLEQAAIFFTTHTYNNRRDYELGDEEKRNYAERIMDFMFIPRPNDKKNYRSLFGNIKEGKGYVYDMASGGLRPADGRGGVARAHRDDTAGWDTWINDPYNDAAKVIKHALGDQDLRVRILAIANGDHRAATAEFFNKVLRFSSGNLDVDVEHPTPDQIVKAKKNAKLTLKLPSDAFYSSADIAKTGDVIEDGLGSPVRYDEEGDPVEWVSPLKPDQMVISFSGRLVPEKAGRGGFPGDKNSLRYCGVDGKGAFDNSNIEELVRRGVQVVIYGNVQTKSEESMKLKKDLIELAKSLKKKNYPGKLVFLPRFSLEQQRMLLAASDVGVHDSYPRTEAAGFTEADDAVCGGIVIAPLRHDNSGLGEGLFTAQGILMNSEAPEKSEASRRGNTLVPKQLTAKAYLDIMLYALKLYKSDELKYNMAESKSLSRVLETRLTSAAYLREFSKVVAEKKKIAERKKRKARKEAVREEEGRLLGEVKPDPKESPVQFTLWEVPKLALYGRIDEALELFFTTGAFQGRKEDLYIPVEIFNTLIEVRLKDESKAETVRAFAKALVRYIAELSEENSAHNPESEEVAKSVQLIAYQALTILSWVDRGVPGAEEISLTADEEKMVTSSKGKSFLLVPETLERAEEEGATGFYWRGTEGITKLGSNILGDLIYDKESFEECRDKALMYLMDHGFTNPPRALRKATRENRISTIHETVFINDFVPGSFQTTSTGAGHFQGTKVDVKHVTAGRGVQVNVKYDRGGRVVEVIAQMLEEGDWTFALPGYVDYMINLGGLKFNDVSISLTETEAKIFSPLFDFSKENLAAVAKAVSEKVKTAPMLAARLEDEEYFIKNDASALEEKWVLPPTGFMDKGNMIDFYRSLAGKTMDEVIKDLQESAHASITSDIAGPSLKALPENIADIKGPAKASLNKTGRMHNLIEDNVDFLSSVLNAEEKKEKIIRIAIESIDDEAKSLLKTIQEKRIGYIELFSTMDPMAPIDYEKYGIKEDVPKEFERTRANTITILPVFKGEELPPHLSNKYWQEKMGGLSPEKTLILPIGFNYDKAGIIRNIILAFMLSEIAGDESYDTASPFVSGVLEELMYLCVYDSEDMRYFDLTKEDIINIARGADFGSTVTSLNKLIKLLPIKPLNPEELRAIYEHAREALIRA